MESKRQRICVSICGRNIKDLEKTITITASTADLIEFRLDCLAEDFQSNFDQVKKILLGLSIPAIITFRPAEQGGSCKLDFETRYAFWRKLGLALPSVLFDLELDIAEQLARTKQSASRPIDWSRVICSHHDFESVQVDLKQIYERMAAVPARVLKIALAAKDATDCIVLFDLLDRARAEGREIITIAMGAAGLATRILGPSRGAFLTYGAVGEKSATAPGQIAAEDLRTVYRLEELDRQTQIMGLVGLPVAHSLSPYLHNAAFEFTGINAVYIPFEVRDLASFFRRMIHPRTRELDWNIRGLSVTAPHKSPVIRHLDWLEPSAKEIGAVNTVIVDGERLRGYNTDAKAFTKSLAERLGPLNKARVAIIGAGGVASAALYGLNQAGACTTVFARNMNRAKVLAKSFGASYENLDTAGFDGFDAVVNATPVGTVGQLEPETPATAAQLSGARLVYDLVYNPTQTRLLREARGAGCETLGGLAMLVAQAAEQFRLWTAGEAPERIMFEAAERALKSSET